LKTQKQDRAVQKEIEEVSRNVKVLQNKPLAITPIIFGSRPGARLEELTSFTTRVRFDLDGFDDHRAWTWLQPTTCIRVWDPDRTGHIKSGRQLFGSVTWGCSGAMDSNRWPRSTITGMVNSPARKSGASACGVMPTQRHLRTWRSGS